jgi:hypothetical protein
MLVKKSSKVSYKILLLSDSPFFKLFFTHIRRHYRGTYRREAQVFVSPPHRRRPHAMLATTQMITGNVIA